MGKEEETMRELGPLVGEDGVYTQTERKLKPSEVPFWTSQRMLMAVFSFWGLFSMGSQRANLSIAIVCMATTPEDLWLNGSTMTPVLGDGDSGLYGAENDSSANLSRSYVDVILNTPLDQGSPNKDSSVVDAEHKCRSREKEEEERKAAEFVWTKDFQGLLLGSVFWGYMVTQVPGGLLSERFGPRLVIGLFMTPVAVLTLLGPVCARTSKWLFLVTRILMGVGMGPMYASVSALFGAWCPPQERFRLVGTSFMGTELGTALMYPISGVLCETFGWTSIFYFTGGFSALFSVLWCIFVRDTPQQCKRISPEESLYLQQNVVHGKQDIRKEGRTKIPWGSMWTSRPFWAIVVGNVCYNYTYYMMMTQMPAYMAEILNFDVSSNGMFSMIPFLCLIGVSFIAGITTDLLLSKGLMSCTAVRKLSSVCLLVPAVTLIGLPFVDCHQNILAVVLLSICVGFFGFSLIGFMVNPGDIAPQYAGTIFGITNFFGTFPGIFAPYIVGVITVHGTEAEWRLVFFIAAGVGLLGGVVYSLMAEGRIQPWAAPKTEFDIPMCDGRGVGTGWEGEGDGKGKDAGGVSFA